MTLLFLAVFVSALLSPACAWGIDRSNPAQVFLPTRMSLPPLALGSLRELLERRLGRSVSLLLRPASSAFSLEDISSQTLLLTEFGAVPQGFPLACSPASLSCAMAWVLAAHRSIFERVASAPPRTIDNLFELMNRARILKEREQPGDVTYPWFESLFFPPTLYHLDHFSHDWRERGGTSPSAGTAGLLHLAMAEGILNPLSVEADENLANEVFEAGDSIFNTMWFPIDPAHADISGMVASDLVFFPFPGIDGPVEVPRVDLRLLVPNGGPDWAMLHPTALPSVPQQREGDLSRVCLGYASWTWLLCDAAEEAEWTSVRFPSLYGKLIRGEP